MLLMFYSLFKTASQGPYAFCESKVQCYKEQHYIGTWIVVLEKTLESPLDCKEIQPVHSKGDQPLDFFGRNDAKGETPVLWPPHAKS